jgi:hypothetical protein
MGTPVICMVTLHGVGFEQPPQGNIPGYADDLHQHLSKYLDETMLGDDPRRKREKRGANGPVYVQSWYPPGQADAKSGLVRLGDWTGQDHRSIDASNAPLVNGNQRIAHVALVYSHLEGQGPLVGSSLVTGEMVSVSVFHYAHIAGLIQMLFTDMSAMFQKQPGGNTQPATGLQVRRDPGFKPARHYMNDNQAPTGLLGILRQLENDVAAYVCRNEMRERVRFFVHDALLRLACRDDVKAIVINSHSNGTVIGLDVMRQLPPFAVEKIKAFVTSGSPLRKYIDLFVWGQQIESVNPINSWINFWDPLDPVGDPLAPPASWLHGDKLSPPYDDGLFQHVNPNTGKMTTIQVEDRQVDNVRNSQDCDLKAHNYWDNDDEFVKPLAEILQGVAASKEVSLNAPSSA